MQYERILTMANAEKKIKETYEEIDQLRKSPNNRIKELRLGNGLTLQELGAKLNIGNNTISQYENHKRYPTIENFIALANYFNVTPTYLAGYDSNDVFKATKELKKAIEKANIANNEVLNLIVEQLEKIYREIHTTNDELSEHDKRITDLEDQFLPDSGADDYDD